jgi:arylsulfatase A-like enzyme
MKDIVLITNDSWRRDTLSSMTHLRDATDSFMTLDAIAQGGSTKTTLPNILSSIYWQEENAPSSSEPISLPLFLGKNGYRTAAFVGTNPFASRWADDFDEFWNGDGRTQNKYTRKMKRIIDFVLLRKETPASSVFDRAKRWYASTSQPRFMWIHLMSTHEPYYPGLRRGLSNKLISSYKTLYEQKIKNRKEDFEVDSLSSESQNILERLYRECIINLDSEMANFVSNINRDATIIITADHGEAFNHGFRKHLQLYDELTRVPFLARWTLDGDLGFSDEIFHIDIAPAIASGLKLSYPSGWRGNTEHPDKERLSLMFNRDSRINRLYIACRTSKYKYIQNYSCSPAELLHEELYNVEQDPSEIHNIFTSSHDFVIKSRQKIERYFDQTGHSPSSLAGDTQASINSNLSKELKEQLSHLGYR